MKSLVQYGLLIVVVIGGVFAVTFFTQNTRSPVDRPVASNPDKPKGLTGPPLEIPEKQAVWDENDRDYAIEIERGGLGHYDFWVRNPHPLAVHAALQTKSCVCTDVQIGLVPPAEATAWRQRTEQLVGVRSALNLLGVPDLTGALAYNGFNGKTTWTAVHSREKDTTAPSAVIPAADGTHGPQPAIVRLNWNSKEVKALRLTADLRYWIGDDIANTQFEAVTVIVPPMMISAFNLSVGEFGVNDRRDMTVYVWSCTRDAFQASISERVKDPCIEVGQPRKLSTDGIAATTAMLREQGAIGSVRMKVAYAIPITVYERRGNAQLDLGPMSRRIEVRSDVGPEVYPVTLAGTVRGNIQIGDRGPDQDRINLGSFRADRPTGKVVMVTTPQSDLELRTKSHKPDYLEVKLEESPRRTGVRQWRLHVEIDANKVSGFLPPDSAIYLETVTNPPRAIRIPVVGNGTVR